LLVVRSLALLPLVFLFAVASSLSSSSELIDKGVFNWLSSSRAALCGLDNLASSVV